MRRLLLRSAVAAVSLASFALAAADTSPGYLQAVEFPYYLLPRSLWERELVWLKAVGVRTVAFSIPWNWHQIEPGRFDFTGATSPRRDLVGFVRLLRRADMRAWVRPLPPVRGLAGEGWPEPHDAHAQQAWIKALEQLLATQTVNHGGPIAFVDGKLLAIDAAAPPQPVATVSAADPAALPHSREALSVPQGALLWENVEDALFPAGWAADPAVPLRKGAVALNGQERTSTAALRRNADLLKEWARLFPALRGVPVPKPAAGKFPEGVSVMELISEPASVVRVSNSGTKAFEDDLRVFEPATKRTLVVPGVKVPPGESLWLPLNTSIGLGGLCRNCTIFSTAEHIVYATAELHAIEFENGILSMEFAAPLAGEVVLQLARTPTGPYLAAGRPMQFDFDEKTLRVRLAIPQGQGPGSRVRIGLAIEAPETSSFFIDAKRLLLGKTNLISTSYSSPEVAARSRLRLPEGWTARPQEKSPVEIDYAVDVPADALHGDWVNLALEADGVLMGRARLQLFRPASIRWNDAMRLHLAPEADLAVEPPVGPADAKAGRNIEIVIRNNSPHIENFHVEASGPGLSFSPASTEVSVGGVMERTVSMRAFPETDAAGLRDWKLKVTGGTTVEMPMRLVLIPRGKTVVWSADLDGDGSPEWVVESQKVRAIFSSRDSGRWIEFTWKDTGINFLPEGGIWYGRAPVEVKASGDALEFTGKGWTRTVRLAGESLSVVQNTALPADPLTPDKRGTTSLVVERESPGRAIFTLR